MSRIGRSIKRQYVCPVLCALSLFVGSTGSALAAKTVKFGAPPWPGVTVKTTVARQLLGALGYETSTTNASWVISVQAVARGDLDVDLGIWMPTQKATVEPLVDSGRLELLVANVPDARYGVVVPGYVWDAGVHCICDLNQYAGKFEHRIYGIEAGNDGNRIMQSAIDHNTYDLGDWALRTSSTAAMLAEAGRHIDDEQWVVFLGWKPHWMNIKYGVRYLEDPKQIWGKRASIHTAVNPEFAKNNPDVTRFLDQMVVPAEIQSEWIHAYGYDKQSAETVASEWIADHIATVGDWLDGVKATDGEPAIEAVRAAFAS